MMLDRQLHALQALDLAMTRLASGQLDDALASAREAARLDPSLSRAHQLEAEIHLQRRDGAAALAALDRHDLYEPARRDEPQVAMLRAQALLLVDARDLARPLLERLAREFPDDTRPHEMLAGLALREGNRRAAAGHLRELLRLRPADDAVKTSLAQALEHDFPAQAAAVLASIAPASRGAAGDLWLARLCIRAGRERDAQELYARLRAARPDDATIHEEAGRLADSAGAASQAEALLQRAVELDHRLNTRALEALAVAKLHAGLFEQAGRCFWRLARHNANDHRAWAGLAVCALLSRRLGLAHRARRALAPRSSRGERQRAFAEFWRHAAAGQALGRARESRGPAASDAGSPLRGLLLRSSATLRRHAQHHPERADTHYHHARCLQALGNLDEARDAVQTALAANPRYVAAAALANDLDAPAVRRAA